MTTPMTTKAFLQARYLGIEAVVGLLAGASLFVLISRIQGEVFLGQYVVFTNWLAMFQSFATLGTPDLILREMGKEPGQGGYLFGAGLVICSGSSVLATGAMGAIAYVLNYPPALRSALLLGSFILFPIAVSTLSKSAYIACHKARTYVSIVVVEYGVFFALNSYFIVNHYGLVTLVATMLLTKLASSIVLLYALNKTVLKVQWGWHTTLIQGLLGPLGAFSMIDFSAKVFWRIDILMLSKMATLGATGLYATAAKFLEIYAMLPSIFAQTMFPDIARQYAIQKLDRNDLELAFQRLLYLIVPVGIGSFVFAEPLLMLLFGERFALSAPALQLFMVTLIVLTLDMLMSITYEAAGYQKNQMYIAVSNILLNIVLNMLLIPVMSFYGACLATFLSLCVTAIVHQSLLSKHVFRLRWIRILSGPFALGATAILPILLVGEQFSSGVRGIAYAVFAGLLFVTVQRFGWPRRRSQPQD